MISHYSEMDFSGNHKLEFPLPELVSSDVMGLTIGYQGYNFKQWTEEVGHTYLWHNRDSGLVEIYTKNSVESLIDTYHKIVRFAVERIVEGINLGIRPTPMDRIFKNKFFNQEYPEFEIVWVDPMDGEIPIPIESVKYTPPKA